jgi:hypothetical protein
MLVLIIGVVLLLASLTADYTLGLSPGFGWLQITGTVVGVILAVVGVVLGRGTQGGSPETASEESST